jgi:phosphoserine phosphatase
VAQGEQMAEMAGRGVVDLGPLVPQVYPLEAVNDALEDVKQRPGGFTRFAEPVAAEIGFDRAIANVLEIHDAALSGTVAKPIVDSSTKERTLVEARERLGLTAHATLAVGDGANDLAMIRLAGLGVAYHAKPVVAAAASARIDRNDLAALLYAQGIPRAEWVE